MNIRRLLSYMLRVYQTPEVALIHGGFKEI